MVAVGIFVGVAGNQVEKQVKAEDTLNYWKENALVNPSQGKLCGAGYIDITFASIEDIYENSSKYGKVKEYKVYVNDEQIGAVSPEDLEKNNTDQGFVAGMSLDSLEESASITDSAPQGTVEYYAVKTAGYEVYIEADYENGSKIYSDVFTFYVSKKGLCVNKNMARNLDASNMNISWYYNWDLTPFKLYSFENIDYVPMMWTHNSTDAQTIERVGKSGYKYILGYNEPDFAEQSNIPVDTAVEGWADFMGKDIRAGSPATALCPPWSDKWFQPFMEKINGDESLDVDFIAVHHYWNWYADEGVAAFLELIDQTYEMYHKPIWITEFAINGDPGNNQEQLDAVIGYMKGVLKGLEERDYVERYSWFSFGTKDTRNGASALYEQSSGELTQLGELYAKTGNPAGYTGKDTKDTKKNKNRDNLIKK